MNMDFNTASKQNTYDLIPADTVFPVVMRIKPGGVGEGGWLTASKNTDAQMLNCEFTVLEGEYTGRKFFQYFVVSGGTLNEKGESKAANITRQTLRGILESSRNVNPDDMSDAAINKRKVNGYEDFNGICFICRIGIQKGTGNFSDQNRIKVAVTQGDEGYFPPREAFIAQGAPSGSAPSSPAPSSAPSWASSPPPPPVQGSASQAPAWAR